MVNIWGIWWQTSTDQYHRYVSRGMYAPDMLVQRLDGAVAVVVCDGEDEDVTICPVDGPGIIFILARLLFWDYLPCLIGWTWPVDLLLAVQPLSIILINKTTLFNLEILTSRWGWGLHWIVTFTVWPAKFGGCVLAHSCWYSLNSSPIGPPRRQLTTN